MFNFWCVLLVINFIFQGSECLIIPEDIPTGLITVYGFSPPFTFGTDSRFGFGFRLGNHADFQILYELGPQLETRPLRTRSARYRRRSAKRPFLRFLLKAGLGRTNDFDDDDDDMKDDEPR